MELPQWVYIVLFFIGGSAGTHIKESGQERVGGAIQYAVLILMLWQAYASRDAGNIDHAMAFSMGAGMMLIQIPLSNVALAHRRRAHKDEPDKSWSDLLFQLHDGWRGTIGVVVFFLGLYWLVSRLF